MKLKVNIDDKKIKVIEEAKICKFSDWGFKEEDIEDFVCDNFQRILGDDTSYLLVGRQVLDKENKRNDLLAIDDEGSLVLIEIKRDADDMSHRKEALEFQAIRYCSSLANLKNPEDLINTSYAKFIEKYEKDYVGELTYHERARKKLKEFLIQNNCLDDFNEKQRIVLMSSDYDKTTLSACAWLIRNGVDITVLKLIPQTVGENHELDIEQLLPTKKESDFFVNLKENNESFKNEAKSRITRTNLPKMDWLIEQKIIKAGDLVYIKGFIDEKATVIDYKNVEYNGETMSFNAFGCKMTGWSTIQIYGWMKIVGNDKTLAELREEKMKELNML